MLALLSALVAFACVLASTRRLALAVAPTPYDPALLLEAWRHAKATRSLTDLRRSLADGEGAAWERDLLAALACGDERSRVALVNEQLGELDWLARRWERVPRVCASVATSAGFLFACVGLMGDGALAASEPRAALVSAVDALAIGIAAAAFCVAVHVRAPRLVKRRLAATDRWVQYLEALAG
jgi:hypothetical protein